jgi:hypothetical protein
LENSGYVISSPIVIILQDDLINDYVLSVPENVPLIIFNSLFPEISTIYCEVKDNYGFDGVLPIVTIESTLSIITIDESSFVNIPLIIFSVYYLNIRTPKFVNSG